MKQEKININSYLTFLKLLNPFAPHLAEELYTKFKKESLVFAPYPKANPALMEESQVTIVISINGKIRDKVEILIGLNNNEIIDLILRQEKIKHYLQNKIIVKWIIVENKIVNIVTE
jgi:leucyl-tRNA synthetase